MRNFGIRKASQLEDDIGAAILCGALVSLIGFFLFAIGFLGIALFDFG